MRFRALWYPVATALALAPAASAQGGVTVHLPAAEMQRAMADALQAVRLARAEIAPALDAARWSAHEALAPVMHELASAFADLRFDVEWSDASFAEHPPAPWARQDPADSLYQAGRQALNRNDYWRAATLFRSIRERYPRSTYAPDSYYWESYALFRRGGEQNLRSALTLLDQQATAHSNAATRRDASALTTRVLGELARTGDQAAALRIRSEVAVVATPPTPPTPPVAPTAPRAGTTVVSRGRNSTCRGGDDDMQMMALNAVLQMDAHQAIPILKKVMARRDETSLCLRRKAVFLVAQHETAETETILLDAVRNDPDQEVKEQAVFWLSQVSGERAVEALENILRTSQSPELQDKAIFALSQHESRRAHAALRAYAENQANRADLREKAIFWIGQSETAESIQFLQGLYSRIREPELRKKILFSVSQSDRVDAGRWLVEVARNPSESSENRGQAIFWAGQRKDTPVSLLGDLYTSMPTKDLKDKILFALSQKKGKAAADKLFEIARTERDPDLRKKALFWLTQTDDPRVAQIIGEILEKP